MTETERDARLALLDHAAACVRFLYADVRDDEDIETAKHVCCSLACALDDLARARRSLESARVPAGQAPSPSPEREPRATS